MFSQLGVNISHTSVWREGQEIIKRMNYLENVEGERKYSIDREYRHRISTKLGVVVALDMGKKGSIVLGTLDEHNPRVVKSWMVSLLDDVQVDISILETGSLDPSKKTKEEIYFAAKNCRE